MAEGGASRISGPAVITAANPPADLAEAVALDRRDGANRTAILNIGGTIMGGQLAAHCLTAAMAAGETREPASLHMLFLASGEPARHYHARTTTLREGRRIAHRQVQLVQDDTVLVDARIVLRAGAADGEPLSYPDAMPDVPSPEDLVPRSVPADADAFERRLMSSHRYMEIRMPAGYRPGRQRDDGAPAFYWMRLPGSAGFSPSQHHALLALVSDFWFNLPIHALAPGPERPSFIISSLDHAVWFHRRPDCSEWLLVESDGSAVHHGLGMSCARYWTRAGELVATVVQQGLIRN